VGVFVAVSWVVIAIYAAVVAGWWLRHVLISLTRPLRLYVEPADAATIRARVSVVLPARNEENRIAGCIETLLRQGAVLQEIILVDDRSEDNTAEVARTAAKGNPRLKILRVTELPDEWSGKAHACQRGAEATSGEWILFADADCRFQPGGLAGALRHAERHKVDLLTLWVGADHRTFWEHMLIPLCGALILYWFPPMTANRTTSSLGYANGQFILIRRREYLRIDGHACAREAVIEDIPLARYAKQMGLRLRTALGPDIVHVRMYTSFSEIYNGWTRIFIGALQRRWKLLASIGSLLGGSLMPSLGGPLAALYVVLRGWPSAPFILILVVLLWMHFLGVYSVSYRLWGLCRCARRHLWLYPVSVVMVIGILLRAWWWIVTHRPILWRGSLTGRCKV
jgi:cellulose synthase/poly-beta-1,6-N-acetylglucosamine synthase-like glycosyltransferase